MNFFFKPITDFLDSIKEYTAFIFFFPVLIGGCIQVIELGFISVSYIRFFSITQALKDGLMVLFVIAVIYIAALININFFSKLTKPDKETSRAQHFVYWCKKHIGFPLLIVTMAIFVP